MRKRNFFIIFVFALVILTTAIIGTAEFMTHKSDGYKISVPYNGYSKTTYYTNKYTEKDGCVSFTDDWGKKRKICGVYEIEEY